jgi:hypothetical protein
MPAGKAPVPQGFGGFGEEKKDATRSRQHSLSRGCDTLSPAGRAKTAAAGKRVMEGQGPAARRPAMVEWREHCLHL